MSEGPIDEDTEDRRLALAARSGDEVAFARLVERYAARVYAVVAGHVGRAEAEDAAQEVFVRAHRGLAGFAGEAKLSTWIFRIATNVGLSRAGARRGPGPLPKGTDLDVPASGPAPDEAAAREERRAAVRRAVAELPERERAVAVLRAFEGLAFDEIARVLGIPRATAESRMARARERLRERLGRWLDRDER
jgi:RNA polymerase sigma-70 factor (ECF subfamily)